MLHPLAEKMRRRRLFGVVVRAWVGARNVQPVQHEAVHVAAGAEIAFTRKRVRLLQVPASSLSSRSVFRLAAGRPRAVRPRAVLLGGRRRRRSGSTAIAMNAGTA